MNNTVQAAAISRLAGERHWCQEERDDWDMIIGLKRKYTVLKW